MTEIASAACSTCGITLTPEYCRPRVPCPFCGGTTRRLAADVPGAEGGAVPQALAGALAASVARRIGDHLERLGFVPLRRVVRASARRSLPR